MFGLFSTRNSTVPLETSQQNSDGLSVDGTDRHRVEDGSVACSELASVLMTPR